VGRGWPWGCPWGVCGPPPVCQLARQRAEGVPWRSSRPRPAAWWHAGGVALAGVPGCWCTEGAECAEGAGGAPGVLGLHQGWSRVVYQSFPQAVSGGAWSGSRLPRAWSSSHVATCHVSLCHVSLCHVSFCHGAWLGALEAARREAVVPGALGGGGTAVPQWVPPPLRTCDSHWWGASWQRMRTAGQKEESQEGRHQPWLGKPWL